MSQSQNSQSQTPDVDPSHEHGDPSAATESQGMEQMAFFEADAAGAAGKNTQAALVKPVDETPADAVAEIDAALPEQSTLFPESLAQRLVAARDVRGWTQQQVAAKLHLPVHVVQWIETGQYERVGQGVYLRGYLTNYARLAGLPADAVDEVLRSKAPPPPELVATGQISHSRYLVERYSGSALYLVLTGVIFVPLVMFAMNMGGNVGSRLTPLDAPAPAVASVEANAANPPASSPTTPSGDAPAAASTAPSTSAADSHDSPLAASFTVVPPPAAESAKPAAAPATSGQLRLNLAEASWVEIVDADGKRLEYSTLPAGTVKEYPADKSLTILIGNTNGARVEVDGQMQDIAPHNRGNVARFKLMTGSRSITTATSEHNG